MVIPQMLSILKKPEHQRFSDLVQFFSLDTLIVRSKHTVASMWHSQALPMELLVVLAEHVPPARAFTVLLDENATIFAAAEDILLLLFTAGL